MLTSFSDHFKEISNFLIIKADKEPFINNEQNRFGMDNYNWCDYDSVITYKPGTFNARYKTSLLGKIKKVEKVLLNEGDISSFVDGFYETYETTEDLELYRTFGKYIGKNTGSVKGADTVGAYVTTEFAESIIDVKMRLALLPKWKNTKMYEVKFVLPKHSIINFGIAAPQHMDTLFLPGGAEQIFLPAEEKEKIDDWAIGYRRITSRQLTEEPIYPFKSVKTIVETMNLYSVFCPKCQMSDIHKITDDEKKRYTFTGCKGGTYTMKYKCMNPECNFLW